MGRKESFSRSKDMASLPYCQASGREVRIIHHREGQYHEAARRLCGWPVDQVVGQAKCYSLLSCHQANGTMLCREQCMMNTITLNRPSEQTTSYSITLKDGREVPVTAHYSAFNSPESHEGYVILTLEPHFPTGCAMSLEQMPIAKKMVWPRSAICLTVDRETQQ